MSSFLILFVAAYLLGSIPFGLVVARLMGGPDPRQEGSKNIGAANVYRVLGRNAGAFTLFGDIMKGAVPVFLARFGLQGLGGWHEPAVAAVGLAAVCGHIWPLYLGFKGGKAVATSFGVILVICPLAAMALAALYGLVFRVWRISSVASLAAAWATPAAVGLIVGCQDISFAERGFIRSDSLAASGKYRPVVPGRRAGIGGRSSRSSPPQT